MSRDLRELGAMAAVVVAAAIAICLAVDWWLLAPQHRAASTAPLAVAAPGQHSGRPRAVVSVYEGIVHHGK